MNRFRSVLYNVTALVALFILVIALLFVFSSMRNQSGAPLLQPASQFPCAPTPNQRSEPSKLGTIVLPLPSVTPLPLSKTSDLAPDLSDRDKVYVYVMRCSGTFELFLIRPNTVFSETIPLQPGDVILNWFPPASLMGHRPPSGPVNTPFGSPLATPTFSSNAPLSSPLATPTPIPLRTPIGTKPPPPHP